MEQRITIRIADKDYTLKAATPEQEELIRKAADSVNKKINAYGLKIDESALDKTTTQNLLAGNYDIWLLVMAKETETTVSTTSKETQEMYQYLAYQSYYNGMYGGGYGYGGYGSGYGSYYNNYLTYAMLAQQASQAYTSTSTSIKLDTDRFYCAALNGPYADTDRVPTLRLVFALPNKEE